VVGKVGRAREKQLSAKTGEKNLFRGEKTKEGTNWGPKKTKKGDQAEEKKADSF